jgi:uncharacterized protein (DUF433 family)
MIIIESIIYKLCCVRKPEMTTIAVIKEHIEITPGVCAGKPCIAGHRITVQNIVVWHEQMGMSPDEILLHYPSINLSDIYAALAYYYDHREAIRQQIEDDENFAVEMKDKTFSLVQQKLKNKDEK